MILWIAGVALLYSLAVYVLYRNCPQLGTRIADDAVHPLHPLQAGEGYEVIEFSLGACVVPVGCERLHEHNGQVSQSAVAATHDRAFFLTMKRSPRILSLSFGRLPRPGRSDVRVVIEQALTARYNLIGLLRRFALLRRSKLKTRFQRVSAGGLAGFSVTEVGLVAGFPPNDGPVALECCTLWLFDRRFLYEVTVRGEGPHASQVRAVAASFVPR